jgi:hypothetical protein
LSSREVRDKARPFTLNPLADKDIDEHTRNLLFSLRLIMAAEGRGPLMHARIGVMRALNRHVERTFDADQPTIPCSLKKSAE